MRRAVVGLVVAATLGLPGAASAQTSEPPVTRTLCVTLTGPLIRSAAELTDRIKDGSMTIEAVARECDSAPEPTAPPAGFTGRWIAGPIEADPITDEMTAAAVLSSDDDPDVGLLVRCGLGRRIEVAIAWGDYLGSDAPHVTTRVDGAEPETRQWNLSTTGTAAFWPGDDFSFIRSLLAADRLVARVTPYNEGPSTAVFTLEGMDNALLNVQEACRWSP